MVFIRHMAINLVIIFSSIALGYTLIPIIAYTDDFNLIQDIAIKNASLEEYEIDKYDCSEFSQNLLIALQRLNYGAISVCGYVDNFQRYHILNYKCKPNNMAGVELVEDINTYHRWVYIPELDIHIESTNGSIIPSIFIVNN